MGACGAGGLVGAGRGDFDGSSELWFSGVSSTEEDAWTVGQGTGEDAREDTEAEIGVVDSEAVDSGLMDMGAVESRAGGSVSTVMEGEGRTAGTGKMAGLT